MLSFSHSSHLFKHVDAHRRLANGYLVSYMFDVTDLHNLFIETLLQVDHVESELNPSHITANTTDIVNSAPSQSQTGIQHPMETDPVKPPSTARKAKLKPKTDEKEEPSFPAAVLAVSEDNGHHRHHRTKVHHDVTLEGEDGTVVDTVQVEKDHTQAKRHKVKKQHTSAPTISDAAISPNTETHEQATDVHEASSVCLLI